MVDTDRLYQDNAVYGRLIDLGLVSAANIRQLHPKTRDQDIPVLFDTATDVVFLERISKDRFYREDTDKSEFEGDTVITETADQGVLKSKKVEDDDRRFRQFRELLKDKSVCDFGTGHGYFLDNCLAVCSHVSGTELRKERAAEIQDRLGAKATIKKEIGEFEDSFDVVTLFHVLEHLEDQIGTLKEIRGRLNDGGDLIVEVPHARDFLIHKLKLKAFHDFTFWSEHLILHTRQSLEAFLGEAGFQNIEIAGFQRHGFANHLYWLRHGKPGGHEIFKELTSPEIEDAYAGYLKQRDWTDTLIATARKT